MNQHLITRKFELKHKEGKLAADKVFFKVYRGSQGTSLPEEKHDGALYVLQTSDETGEL